MGSAEELKEKGSGDFLFGADPQELYDQLPDITAVASDVTTKVREFKYGANGDLLNAQIETIDNTANNPTYAVRMIYYDADYDKVISKTGPIVTTADEAAKAASNKAKINFDANDDIVSSKIADIQTLVSGSTGAVNSGLLGTYNLGATTTGVATGVEAAAQSIAESIANTNTTYHLQAVFDGFSDLMPLFDGFGMFSNPMKGRPLRVLLAGLGPEGEGDGVEPETEPYVLTLEDMLASAYIAAVAGQDPFPFKIEADKKSAEEAGKEA